MAESFSGSVGLNDGQTIPIGINLKESSCQKFKAQLNQFEEQCSKEGNITIKTQISKDGYKQLSQLKNAYGDVITKMKQFNAEGTLVSEQVTKVASKSRNSKGAIDEYANAVEKLKQKNLKSTSSFKELSEGFNKVKEESEKVVVNGQKFTKTMTTLKDETGKTTRVVKTLTSETGETSSALLRESKSADTAKQRTNELGGALETTGRKAKSAGVGLADFTGTMVKIAQFQLINGVLSTFTGSVTEAIGVVKEFDDALTEFKKVSELSGSSLDSYSKKLGELGTEVARTRSEMVSSATEMKKSGFSDEQSAELAKISEMYRNTADEMISSAQSAGFIISQMKAFGNETTEFAQHTIDAVNNVSDNMSVSSSDISEGLTKTSSALGALGNNFEQSMAMVAGATEVLHGQASKVSRGLRTIGNNFANMAQKSGELQYKVEGVTKTLSLFDEKTGDLKSTYQIFDELKENWEKMSNAEKQELAINSAGKNQFEVFVAELDRFTAVRKAYGLAVNDNNMAEKENARYMESISAKISLFQNQLQELILGNGGLSFLVKGFLDATNAILKFANSGIGQFIIKATLLKTAITGATTAFNMLKASAKVTALIETVQQVGQLTRDYGLLTGVLKAYIIAKQQDTVASATNTGAKTAETGATVALTEAEGALNIMQQAQAGSAGESAVAIGIDTGAKVTATGATTTLTMAQEALNLAMESNPVLLIITGLVALAGVTYGVAKAIDANRETVEDLNEESDKYLEKANKTKTKVEELTKEYDENCKKIEELKSQEGKLGKSDYTNQLNSLKVQNSLLEDQIKLQKEIEEREKRKAADKKWQALNKVDNTKEYLTYGTGGAETGAFHVGSTLDQVKDQRKALDAILSDYNKFSSQYLEAQKAGNEEGQKQAQEHLEQLKENAKNQEEELLETSKTLLEDLKVFTDDATGEPLKGKEEEYNQLSSLISQVTKSTDEYNNILGVLNGTSSEATNANDALASATSNAGDSATDAKDKFAELSDQLSKSVSNMDSVVDAYKTLKSAVSEYNSKGKLSYNTLKSILSLNPKYLSALSVQNGKLKLNEKALKAQWEQEKKNAKSEIEASGILGKLAGKEKDVGDKANSANPKVSAFGENIASSGDKASSASSGLQTYQNKIDDISSSAGNGINFINSFGRALSRLSGLKLSMKQMKKTVPMFDFNNQLSDPNWQGGGTKKSSKNKNKNKHKGKSSTSEQSVTDILFNHVNWNDEPMPSSSGGSGGSSRHSGGGGGGGSSSSSKARAEEARRKAEEKKKKAQEKKLREAKQALNKVIRASIKEIDDETNAYKKNYKWQQKQLNIAKKKEKQLKNQKTTYENVKKYIDEMYDSEINKLKDVEDEFQNLVQKERDALEHDVTIKDKDGKTETVKKNYVEIGRILEKAKSDLDVLTDGYDRVISRQERLQRNDQSIKNKEKEIKDLEAELKEKQKINDEEERKIQLQELQNALDRTKNMRVKVYRKGEGFVYGQDQDAINEAQKNLNNYLRQKEETDIQDKIDKAQEELDSLNKVYEDEIQRQEDLKQKAEDAYHDQYDALQGWYDDTTALYEDYLEYRTEYKVHSEKLDKDITTSEVLSSKKRIENLEKEKKKFDELWDAEEKKRHEKLVQELTGLKSTELGEQESYDNRIKIFEKFVSDYENLVSRLEKAEKKVTKQQNKTDSAKTAYDFQKDQDKSQKEALEKIKDKTDKAKTTKEVRKNKKAVEALTEYQKAIDKSQHELYSKVKKGSMTTNQAIEEYNMWTRHWYNYYNLEKYGVPFTYSATGVYTQGKASMFGGKKATGDASIKQNGVYLVGDSPNQELVIGSKVNGIPMNLPQGTGVVNAKSTKTFAGLLNTMGAISKDKIGTLNKNTTNNDNFSISNVTVNGANINDGKSFANELLSLKAEMLQSAYRR